MQNLSQKKPQQEQPRNKERQNNESGTDAIASVPLSFIATLLSIPQGFSHKFIMYSKQHFTTIVT